MTHLVVSISGHGYGHVAQTAPILNLLHASRPDVRITIRTAVPPAYLHTRITAPFLYQPSEGDIGMLMNSALDVDAARSQAAYQAYHATWNERVEDEADRLRELKADVVFSNVGYLALAGAQRLGIPNVALCSLNWYDIYRHFAGENPIASQIKACYRNADAFLRTTPGMAMADLTKLQVIPPIAMLGRNRREELNTILQLKPQVRLVLVSLGGIASRLPMEQWPRIANVRWLVQQSWQVQHPDAIVLDTLPFSFSDLLASSDALLTKPGYGSFAEAACGGIPVLYVDRPDWPETPALTEWLQQQGVCREISRTQLEQGDIAEELQLLLHQPKPIPPRAEGAKQAAAWLLQLLARSGH